MGAISSKNHSNKLRFLTKTSFTPSSQEIDIEKEELHEKQKYDEDVLEAVNLVIGSQDHNQKTNIELQLKCLDLKLDSLRKSNPMVVFLIEIDNQWVEQGRTDIQLETTNPKFMKTFVISYSFDIQLKMKFELYNILQLEQKDNLFLQQFIGSGECEIHQIVCDRDRSYQMNILNPKVKNQKKLGQIVIKGQEYDISSTKYIFNLGVKGIQTTQKLFLKISAIDDQLDTVHIYSTDFQQNQKFGKLVEFRKFFVPSSKFPGEDTNLNLEIFEYNPTSGEELLGDVQIKLNELTNIKDEFLELQKKDPKLNNQKIVTGYLKVFDIQRQSRNSFLNYLFAGTKINILLGIDFTNSNGSINDPQSLHHLPDDEYENAYIKSIKQVLKILQFFDKNGSIPVYGFGAKLPPNYNIVSHCFACNGNYFQPLIRSIDDIIRTYKDCIKSIKFHGPSVLSEILKMAGQFCNSEVIDDNNHFYKRLNQ